MTKPDADTHRAVPLDREVKPDQAAAAAADRALAKARARRGDPQPSAAEPAEPPAADAAPVDAAPVDPAAPETAPADASADDTPPAPAPGRGKK